MPTKTSKKSAPSYSLISDKTFQRMHAAMATLRSSAKRNAGSRGAEAAIAGTIVDLRPSDLILAPTSLFPATMVADGLLQLTSSGRKTSLDTSIPIISTTSPGAGPIIAAGAALGRSTAALERGTLQHDSVIVAFGTPGVAHRPDWLEALRLAGAHRLPILFVLLPGDEAEAARIGSEAVSAGVITIPVDTSDAVAIYRVAFESLARARRRTATTLIVSTQYKIEDAKPSRSEDPIKKLESYLKNKGIAINGRRSPVSST